MIVRKTISQVLHFSDLGMHISTDEPVDLSSTDKDLSKSRSLQTAISSGWIEVLSPTVEGLTIDQVLKESIEKFRTRASEREEVAVEEESLEVPVSDRGVSIVQEEVPTATEVLEIPTAERPPVRRSNGATARLTSDEIVFMKKILVALRLPEEEAISELTPLKEDELFPRVRAIVHSAEEHGAARESVLDSITEG